DADLEPAGFDWITALRAPTIKALAAEGGPLQLSLFDERDMAEIASDDYPGERLIVCRNPELAAERTRKRAELIEATEKALVKIRAMTERKRNPLRGKAKIALKVGAVLDRRHMAKHFELAISDTSLAWSRKAEAIAAEAALDGIYVIRTNLPRTASQPPPSSSPTRASATPNAASATSNRATSTSARSTIAGPIACGRTSSCACWPTTSSGT